MTSDTSAPPSRERRPGPRVKAGRRPAMAGAVALTLLLCASPRPSPAQHTRVPEPAAYALRGVTLVAADGSRTEGVDILVRGRYVETIGEGLEVPADARVLEGDSLRIYPGIVDADGGAEVEFPEPEEREDVERWDPPRDRQGFLPHRRAADHLAATGESLRDARLAGVVAGAAIPDGGLAPGKGAFLLYRPEAEEPRGLVVDAEVGHVLSFERAGRIYPSTLFGVIAFLRQQFLDAGRDGEVRSAYASDPRGVTAPAWDPAFEAMREIAGGGSRVFFRADNARAIRRALDLGREHGFRPIIVGGGEAWKVAERLRSERVSVLVSTDFGVPDRWDPDEEAEELDPEVLREKRRFEERYANAGRLADAGVGFALTSGGGEADIREGARTAIEHGLSEAAALRAVTSAPASLLGAPHLARVDEGLPATFIVADGPLFAEETKVAFTFVEGRLEEGDASERPMPEEEPAFDLSGSWETEVDFGRGTGEFTLVIEQADDGTFEAEIEGGIWEGSAVEDGMLSGTEVSFVIVRSFGERRMRIRFSGSAGEESMSGTARSSFGRMEWSAEKTTGPGTEGREDDR